MIHLIFGRSFVKRFVICYRPVVLSACVSVCLSVYNIGVLWPNGWMDQDEFGMEVGLDPGHIVLDEDPALVLAQ